MGERMKRVFHSLGFCLLVPLLTTVGVVLAIYAMISFSSTKDHFLQFVQADIGRSSELIKRATHDGMLLNRKEEVQATIQRLAEGPAIASIRVYDKEGIIVMSAREEEIGQEIELDSETCLSCHEKDRTRDVAVLEREGLSRIGDGSEVLRHLSVIENEPSCAATDCHLQPSQQRVLGILDLEMSMAPLDATIRVAQNQFLWATVVLMLIVGMVVAIFFRRVIHRPVLQLNKGTRRIAAGDLDTRIEVRGGHELARLGEAFNRMVCDLGAARQEVVQWSEKLEEKVAEKTKELGQAQRQVLHMEKMASLGKLSATVAHELNNPLSGILTYARLVRRELGEQSLAAATREELNRYLSFIEKECSRCGDIVQNLMLFARRTGAAMAPVDLNEVVERSLMLVRHHLEISGVKLHSRLLDGDSCIMVDAGQLQQALVALLVNAVEAMSGSENGEGELSVLLSSTDDEVTIDIADNGLGIPPEILPQIFEPFFSTKEAENGVGLGLAVVYGIIQRHGGRIDVESEVGHGTVFHLWLPRHATVDEEKEATVFEPSEADRMNEHLRKDV